MILNRVKKGRHDRCSFHGTEYQLFHGGGYLIDLLPNGITSTGNKGKS